MLLCFSLFTTFLFGQEQEVVFNNPQFGIEVDQDYFMDAFFPDSFNEDRNYTQGTAFSYSDTRLYNSPLFSVFRLIDKIEKRKKIRTVGAKIGLGVTAFTPLKLDSINPVVGDRPFANNVFLSFSRTRFNPRNNVLKTMSINLGFFGSNVANVFQSFAHKI